MSTHAIGTGTRNLSVNVPTDELNLWGRLAFQMIAQGQARSTGDAIRKVMLRGLESTDRKAAGRLKEIRRRYYSAALLILLSAATAASWFGAGDLDAMRSLRAARRGSVVRRAEWEEA